MKIMLVAVNAKYIHSNLAVYSLNSYVKEYQKNIVVGEYTINQKTTEILKDIYQEKPDVLGFSCYIWNISQILELASEIAKILPQTQIWLGGPEVSYDSKKVLKKRDFITGIIRGEGEQTFLELVEYYLDKRKSLLDIKGIIWRTEDGKLIENENRELLNLSDIPFPYEKFPEHRIVYYESSRGCPFSCSYCLSSVEKRLRFRDIEIVKSELQHFLDNNVPQVKFVDRTFNCNHEHAMEVWEYIKEHDNGVTNFHFEIAADILNDEEVAILNSLRIGQVQLESGVQSTNLQTLKAINRTMDFAKVSKRVSDIMKGENVHQHLDLIVGLPYESYDSFRNSFNDVYALAPHQLQVGFLKVLKGSKMAIKADEYECQYQDKEPYEMLQTKWLSFAEVLKLKQLENMVEIYYNSAQFEKTIPQVVKLFATPFDFYQELGDFYEAKGYATISHSRMRRYDILLEFLNVQPGIDLNFYKELLLYDLYAREKLKKMPVWVDEYVKMPPLFDYNKRSVFTNNAEIIKGDN